jgi:hypothetical protein
MNMASAIRRLLFSLALLVVLSRCSWSQIALVNVTSCGGGETLPGTCTITSTGSGHLLVVGIQMGGGVSTSTTISSVTDNAGNVYAEAGAARSIDSGASSVADIWYAANSIAGATTITITTSASTSGAGAVIWEFSGVSTSSPLDKTAVLNSQPSSATVSGAAVTTTSSAEVVISLAAVAGNVTGIASGNSFTSDSTLKGNGWAHLVTSSTGTYAAQWTQSPSGTYTSSTASFKAASSTPSFTLSAAPASQSVMPGTNAGYTISVAPSGGFTGAVSLSATGLPTGSTASFNPASITSSQTSTLTVPTTASTAAGNYSLTITGTSASLNETAAATLVVATTYSACDVNKDGLTNVLDVQLASNNGVSCSTTAFQTFYSQVITGVVSSCPVTSGLHTVALSWTASTTSGVTYNVYRATTSGGENYSSPLATGLTGTSFTDCTVALGQTYYYTTEAVSGTTSSAPSGEVSVTIPAS